MGISLLMTNTSETTLMQINVNYIWAGFQMSAAHPSRPLFQWEQSRLGMGSGPNIQWSVYMRFYSDLTAEEVRINCHEVNKITTA